MGDLVIRWLVDTKREGGPSVSLQLDSDDEELATTIEEAAERAGVPLLRLERPDLRRHERETG